MADRGFYGRFKTGICALMYCGELHREKNCEVANISETGICFEVSAKDLSSDMIHDGDKIDFQFVDKSNNYSPAPLILCLKTDDKHDKHYDNPS